MDLSSIARGSVFVWFDYVFEDGSKKDKYIITFYFPLKPRYCLSFPTPLKTNKIPFLALNLTFNNNSGINKLRASVSGTGAEN